MTVVAEMVENEASGVLLREMGVDCFQGNYFGPAEVTDITALRRQRDTA